MKRSLDEDDKKVDKKQKLSIAIQDSGQNSPSLFLSAPADEWAAFDSPLLSGLVKGDWTDRGICSVKKICGVEADAAEWMHILPMIRKPSRGTRSLLLMEALFPQLFPFRFGSVNLEEVMRDFWTVHDELKAQDDSAVMANFWAVTGKWFKRVYSDRPEIRFALRFGTAPFRDAEDRLSPLEIAALDLLSIRPREPVLAHVDGSMADLARACQAHQEQVMELEEALNDMAQVVATTKDKKAPLVSAMMVQAMGQLANECLAKLPPFVDWAKYDFYLESPATYLHLSSSETRVPVVWATTETVDAMLRDLQQQHDSIQSSKISGDKRRVTVTVPALGACVEFQCCKRIRSIEDVDAFDCELECKQGQEPRLLMSWMCARALVSKSIHHIRERYSTLDLLELEDAGYKICAFGGEENWLKRVKKLELPDKKTGDATAKFIVPPGMGLMRMVWWFKKVYSDMKHKAVLKGAAAVEEVEQEEEDCAESELSQLVRRAFASRRQQGEPLGTEQNHVLSE